MFRFAILLFIALFALSAAGSRKFNDFSPARQRIIKKLAARRKELQKRTFEADQRLQKLTRERQVAQSQLHIATRKLNTATEECRKNNGKCGELTAMENAVSVAKEKFGSVKEALSEATDPEGLEERRRELKHVSEQLIMLQRLLYPISSVLPRPI